MADEAPLFQADTSEAAPASTTPEPSAPETQPVAEASPEQPAAQPAQPSSQPDTAAQQAAQPAQQPWWSSLGADESAAQAAVNGMRQQLEQMRQLAPYANFVAQYPQEVQEFIRARHQKQQPAAAPATEKSWYDGLYEAPEYDPAWLTMVQKNPTTGLIESLPGYPAEIGLKVQAALHHQQQVQRRFLENPPEFIKPFAERIAEQVAEKVVQRHLGGRDEQQLQRDFINQNNGWLYERDDKGQQRMTHVWDPNTGRQVQTPVLSVWGKRYRDLLNERHAYQMQRFGQADYQDQLAWALAHVKNEYYEWAQQHGQPQAAAQPAPAQPAADPRSPREKANEQWLAGQPKAGSRPSNGNTAPADTPVTNNTFASHLLRELETAGAA